jgi:small-conductance mechanosensitive channel
VNAATLLTVVTRQADEAASSSDTTVDVVCDNAGQLCDALYELTDSQVVAETTSFLLGVPVKIIIVLALALVVNRIARRSIRRFTDRLGRVAAEHGEAVVNERNVIRAEERATTIGSLLRSLTTATVFGVAGIMILEVLGVSLVPLIASAGVLSLAVGFGAQSVVEDLLRGLFMLSEDQFGVGDRIDVGHVNGYVERVTLRTVVVRDSAGTLWHVPNSQIDWVANENQTRSRATVLIGVSYAADLERATSVLDEAARAAGAEPEWHDLVRDEPQVQGVHELGDDAVMMRVVVWVDAPERRRFERHLRRRLKEALDRAGIEMPNRQVDVWLRHEESAA